MDFSNNPDFDLTVSNVLLVHKNRFIPGFRWNDYLAGRKCDGIAHCLSGKGIFRFDKKANGLLSRERIITPGETVFLPKGSAYSLGCCGEEPFIHYTANFILSDGAETEDTTSLLPEKDILFLPAGGSPVFVPLFEKLLSVWQSKENGYRTFAKSVLTELLFRFFSEAVRVNRSPKGDNRLRPALQALADVRAEIKVSDLALLCRMSESTFRREFRQVFGVSPAAYRLDRKVLYAKELLLSGELTVGDVAEAVGIRDANYFARLFRRKTGKTPREFASET